MDETEFEGEACAFQEDGYGSIDPDVSFSYIDDKIQNVLGHFKKDFEGLVSVENLGPKYGIYGSFLPTYRLSPTQSQHSRINNNMASQSQNSMTLEGGHPHSVRHGSPAPSVHKAPCSKDLCRKTSRTQSVQTVEECTPKSEVSDSKRLKVRIKVGSDTLSAKESASIYSGLGLDGSPASSLDGSPTESEELSLVMPVEVVKCAAQILQIMTSFPLDGGYLLSPLPYDLIQLIERPKVLQGFLTKTSLKANQENNDIGQPKNNRTFSGDSVAQLLHRKGLPLQGNRYGDESHAGFDLLFKESDIGESPKASFKERDYSVTAQRGSLEPSFVDGSLTDEPNGKENTKRNLVHNRGADAPGETVNYSGKISTDEGKTDSKSRKASKRELKDTRKQKSKRSVSCDDGKNKLSSRDKKKLKKSEAHGLATRSKANENALGPDLELKDRNYTETNNHACQSQSKNSSVQMELSNSRDKFEHFFGDLNEHEADKGSEGLEVSQIVDKDSSVYGNTSRWKASSSEIHRRAEAEIKEALPGNGCDSDGGHNKKSIINTKKESDQEFSGITKKSKRETAEEGNEILCVSLDYDPATNTAIKGQMTNSEYVSSRISKNYVEGESSNANDKPTYPDEVCLLGSESDAGVVAPSKRKADNSVHPLNSTLSSDKLVSDNEQSVVAPSRRKADKFLHPLNSTPSSDKLVSDNEQSVVAPSKRKADNFLQPPNSTMSSDKLISHDEHFNKKKHRASKSKGKERIARNGKDNKMRKSKVRRSLENIDSLQKYSSAVQPVLAETLSSSKVLSSLEVKYSTHELKRSPIISEKGNVPDVDKLAIHSPRKYSDDDCKSGHAKSSNDHFSLGKDENKVLKYCSGNDKIKISEFGYRSQDKKPAFAVKQRDGKLDARKKPKDLVPTSEEDKSQCLPRYEGEKNDTSNCPQLYKDNNVHTLSIGASATDLIKELKPNAKTDSQRRIHHSMSKSSLSNGYKGKNQDTPSPLGRDASSEAARNAIKEARNLKHLADRLKKGNGSSESTEMYFEAALKFLLGASLVESGKTDNVESMKIYSDTAELCEFCAREYERSKDMAMAALAYKCMEVAYMRVICISQQSASRDRDELQTVLQIVPPGESPSSSASDIDNLNNSVTGDKARQVRSIDTHVSMDLLVTPSNRPNFNGLLSFAQTVNLAMGASRKSRAAFTAANDSMDKLDSKEGIISIKRALNFNFHDIDGLLLLVRLAKEVTNR